MTLHRIIKRESKEWRKIVESIKTVTVTETTEANPVITDATELRYAVLSRSYFTVVEKTDGIYVYNHTTYWKIN